jgi:hypothetical protein
MGMHFLIEIESRLLLWIHLVLRLVMFFPFTSFPMIHLSSRRALTAVFVTGTLFGSIVTTAGAALKGSAVFSDVPAGSYYDDAVGEMYNDGVIKGNPDGTYRPGDPVSRAEIAVMLQRFKDSLDGSTVVRSSSSRSRSSSSDSSSSSSSSSSVPTTNPAGIFRFATGTFTVAENASVGTVNITVVRTGGNQGTVSVDYAVTSNTATSGSDFEALSGTLTFASKETSKTFTVKILNDTSSEGTETATVTLSKPTNSAIIGTPNPATINITDDEAGSSSSSSAATASVSSNANGILSIAATTYGVLENVGTLSVTVNRASGTTGTVGVAYSTANGTGNSSTDYTAANGTLTFAAGETSKTFTVNITDDPNVDGAKTFTIKLASPTGGAALGTDTSTVTIFDNESTTDFGTGSLKLVKSSFDVSESDKKIDMTVQRVGGTKGSVSVNYNTTNGTAVSGTDFTLTTGTLTFAPGESSKVITIPIVDDTNSEQDDYFFFDLSGPTSNATLSSPSTATINLFD